MASEDRLWRVAAIGALVVILVPPPAAGWRVRVARAYRAGPVAIDGAHNVFAAISVPAASPYDAGVAVVKLAHADGAERWRRRLRAAGPERSDFVNDLQMAADGDVVAAGTLDDDGHASFFVARLAGGDGHVRWKRIIQGRQLHNYGEQANSLAFDASGDVVAAGCLEGGTMAQSHLTHDFAVVKLEGVSGEERWRFLLDGSADEYDCADAVAVDGAGSVIAVGTVTVLAPTDIGYRPLVSIMKLAGDDGHLLWRRDVDAAWRASGVVLDGVGDVFIPASTTEIGGNDFGVFKLSGTTGEPIWTARISGSDHHWQEAFQVRVLPTGDVVAVGFTADADGTPSLTAVLLDGATGLERWRRLLRGTDGSGIGRALALRPQGDIVIGGQLRDVGTCYDLTFGRLAALTGEVLELRTFDGTARASQCDAPDCGDGGPPRRCGPPRAGIDQDDLWGLGVDQQGHIVVAGVVSDGARGRSHAFVAAVSPRP